VSHRSLSAQIVALNALLLSATVLAAIAATQGAHDGRDGALLAAAVLLSLLANAFVVRRRLAPLDRLLGVMERVDGVDDGEARAVARQADSQDVRRLLEAFNAMLARVEAERSRTRSAVLRAQEAERARLARDLHDECNQALTGVLLRLEVLAHDAPDELRAGLRDAREVTAQAMDELLRLARELRPTALDDLGLEAALRSLVGDGGTLEVFTDLDALDDDEQVVAYRVVQEALSNARRHGGAHRVRVLVGTDAGEVVVRVVDDGSGFDPAAPTDGLGLTGMAERARLAGGRVDVRSAPGAGTTVELRLCAS
jgi:two-component system, NarL family, sensor histidine kinase UhpB